MAGMKGFALFRMKGYAPKNRLLLLPVALLAASCATTVVPPSLPGTQPSSAAATGVRPASSAEQQMLQALVAQQDRLYRVAGPLLVNNHELCKGNARNLLGFTAKNKYSYSAELMPAAQTVLGLQDRLQIMGVLAGSGAASAGVRPGDILLNVEGTPLPAGEKAESEAAAVLAPLVVGRSNVALTALRGGSTMTLNVPLTYACAFGIELGNSDNVVAYSDGHRLLVTRGMLNAMQSDQELAYVMAKEMAHNMLAHANQQRMSATIGGIIDNLALIRPDMSIMAGMAGVRPMPQEFDAMADKLSLYLLARAGYSIDGVVPFWKRMASRYPATVLNGYTALHPSTAYRVAAMEKTVKDIRAKQARKKPLLP
jgi:beta-barrel assembly-enhancing protease